MAGAMMQEQNQRQLEVELFHNQAGYLSDPPAEHMEMFGSLIRGLNNCPITHALRVEPVAEGAGTIDVIVQKKKIIISEAIVREVLRLGDLPQHPTSYNQTRVIVALRRVSYDGAYQTVLKKLFPLYWRLLVHFFLQCIAENKGGFDQLNKTQTCALMALVNEWDINFSAFIFDNMKKMLGDPKKKKFMLYPRFLQMIFDEKYPELVKGPNYINLKLMGPSCFENAYKNKRAKNHNFVGKFNLEKHGRFSNVVYVAPVAPVSPHINAQIAEEHDVQHMQQVAGNEDEVETEILDSGSETSSSEEETDSESEVGVIMSGKEEEVVRQSVPMTSENLAALLLSLQGCDGNTPSVPTVVVQDAAATTLEIQTEIEAITNDAKEIARKKQRTNTVPDHDLSGSATDPEPTPSVDPQPDPQSDDASMKTSTKEPNLYDFNFDFESTPSQPGSPSGVRVEVGGSRGVGNTKHDEAAFRYASEKRKVFEHSDSDNNEDAYVTRLKRPVVILEQDAELKNAQISSLQQDAALKEAHISSL
ncbi:hypothetical protein Hanom_Chr00s001384g01681051 [Helianthus anomalus]